MMPEQANSIEHLLPPGAEPGPVDVSIVVPSLNEEITVGEFVAWCKEGLARAAVRGQILIVDSSTDKTPEIVLAHGGEVLRTPKRGLGRAYIDAANYIRGQWIVMGDADLTYDFRELIPFVEAFRKGAVCHGQPGPWQHRERSHARPASLLRNAVYHLDSESNLRQRLFRYPLRHARTNSAGPGTNRPEVAVLGI